MKSISNENNNPFMLKGVRNERGYWIVDNDRYNAEEVTLVMHEVILLGGGEVICQHVDVLPWVTDLEDHDMLYHPGSGKHWYVSLPYESVKACIHQKLITTSKNQMFVK